MAKANGSLSHFQKRHYEAIALAMQHAQVIGDPAKRNQWESVRNELARCDPGGCRDLLPPPHPRFHKSRCYTTD